MNSRDQMIGPHFHYSQLIKCVMAKIVKLNVSLALVNFILSNNTNTTAKPTAHDLSA